MTTAVPIFAIIGRQHLAGVGRYRDVQKQRICGDAVDRAALAPELSGDD